MGGTCSTNGRGELHTLILVGKPNGKRALGSHWRRWECNIKMDFQEIVWGVMKWIDVAYDRDRWRVVVNAVMFFRVQ